DVRTALAALATLVGGLELDRERLAAAVADPLLRATDAAELLVLDGQPFRDAHEAVAAEVRAGTFSPPTQPLPRPAPGPGGAVAALRAARLRLDTRSLADLPRSLVGRDLPGYLDALAVRWPSQDDLETLAEHAAIPVINALTDDEHPCQALADVLTIRERLGGVDGVRVAYVGDGNNVLASLLVVCSALRAEVVCATPAGYEPKPAELAAACAFGGKVSLTHDPHEAVAGAQVVYTDVWTSMGEEAEHERR